MMTDKTGRGGFGDVYADLFDTCPKELRDALPAGTPKNLTSNNVPVRSMMGGESVDGVGIHLATGKGNEPPHIWGIVRASPAAKAGIEPGSFLLSVNGTNTAALSGDQCRRLVEGRTGTTVKLELADPARQQTNQITLERRRSHIAD
jgi:C-terminal processing protease CtpA/Prc